MPQRAGHVKTDGLFKPQRAAHVGHSIIPQRASCKPNIALEPRRATRVGYFIMPQSLRAGPANFIPDVVSDIGYEIIVTPLPAAWLSPRQLLTCPRRADFIPGIGYELLVRSLPATSRRKYWLKSLSREQSADEYKDKALLHRLARESVPLENAWRRQSRDVIARASSVTMQGVKRAGVGDSDFAIRREVEPERDQTDLLRPGGGQFSKQTQKIARTVMHRSQRGKNR
ncbi:hypothetical protein B0H16DRAFT_1505708 [Mycena metata]|uniref:Uncharacterized protein n=1 Tax=Mycena metata TaxID=1033252 RepID=A0AAD7K191_9AGAR|nr:hypothetical protein B0H16DRAFT_1505708 [Mycena metata]